MTHALIRQTDGQNQDLLLRWMVNFSQLTSQLMHGKNSVNHLQQFITPQDLFALEVCADLLHRRSPEATITPQKIPELIKLVREIVDAIGEDDDLPVPVRLHLIDRLREVEHALIHIRTTGYAGVESALDKLTGTIAREPELINSKETVGFWRQLLAAIGLASEGAKAIGGTVESTAAAIEAIQSITS